jgi:hypothetical protein
LRTKTKRLFDAQNQPLDAMNLPERAICSKDEVTANSFESLTMSQPLFMIEMRGGAVW